MHIHFVDGLSVVGLSVDGLWMACLWLVCLWMERKVRKREWPIVCIQLKSYDQHSNILECACVSDKYTQLIDYPINQSCH